VGAPAGRREPAEPLVRPGDLTRDVSSRDWRITAGDHVGEGTARERLHLNLAAIRIVKQLQKEDRLATEDERRQLVRYVGWGGMPQIFDYGKREWAGPRADLEALLTPEEFAAARASTMNAHYTSPEVVRAMWAALEHMGLEPGFTMIEPAVGTGNFLGLQPDSLLPSRRTGIEMDPVTAAIAKALYPDSNIQNAPYQKVALPHNFFDVAISNVPFGNFGVADPKYRKHPELTRAIHDYYFAKSLDLVRPGGIVAFITSHYTLDKLDPAVREYLAEHADLLGAIRLPDTAFKANAGTEVTTDLVFLRKRAPGEPPSGEPWTKASKVQLKDGSVPVNEYFQEHPQMVLGQLTAAGTMYGGDGKELAVKGNLTEEALSSAIQKLPRHIWQPWKAETPAFEGNEIAALGDPVKEGGYAIRNGVIVRREGSLYRPAALSGKAAERVKGMIPIRDAVHEVFKTQIEEASDARIKAARTKLNQVYDDFVKKYGPISLTANRLAFADDPDLPMLSALEHYDSAGKTATKAAIFSERTIAKPQPVDHVETAAEALGVALNERGRIDWTRMQELTGKTPEELRAELGPLVYQNPEGQAWETADSYLSGNVRDKLDLARAAAQTNSAYERNVEALEKVIPADLQPSEIKASLGSAWIPPETVADFLAQTLDLPAREVRVVYSPAVAEWSVSVPKYALDRAANRETWGTAHFSGNELAALALNSRAARVYKPGEEPGSRVLDVEGTQQAEAAMQALKDRFAQWAWEDPKRAHKLATKYNREFNGLRLRQYDGSHLTLPGSNPAITLRPHQKDAIWRIVSGGNTLLAHEVGAGKTWEMVGAAMELRRLGLAKKPMLVVPNHMVNQFASEFLQLYPSARILAAGRDEMAKDKRQRAIARIASGNYDAVILAHSSFGKIGVGDDVYQKFIGDQIRELENALSELAAAEPNGAKGKKSRTVKEIEKAKARLEAKLEKRLKADTKDKSATFEQLGVDYLMIDEAHAYKNLPVITKRSRIAGIPTAESDRSMDMLMKSQHVTAPSGGGRGLVFATGTPITNTMAELYNMQRYLQMNQLKELGLQHFDAWANTFGEPRRGIEMDVTGGFRENTRFSKFVNLPELLTMFRQAADVKTAEMMKLPRPALAGGGAQAITAPESPELADLKQRLNQRVEAIRGGHVDPRLDNMLKIVSEGKKAALDMRLIDPYAADRPDSKVNQAVDNIYRIWHESTPAKSTQLVFIDLSTPKSAKGKKKAAEGSDEAPAGSEAVGVPEGEGEKRGFSVYDDMRQKLIARGVPSKQIAFIHDYGTGEEKQELFDAVNRGDIRVLFGSTEKMGVGTNVQRKLLALHHMDTPWRPSDVKQRDGRIQRQGNTNKEVQIYQYLTEGSLDAYSWQTLENKDRFISQVMNGDLTVREAEDIGLTVPSAAEWKAISSGNPLIKEKIGVDSELQKLDAQRAGFQRQQGGIQQQIADLPSQIRNAKDYIAKLSADAQTIADTKSGDFTVGKKTFSGKDGRSNAASALGIVLESWRGPGLAQRIGSYKGLEIWTRPGAITNQYPGVQLRGEITYDANANPENPAGTLQSIENVARGIAPRVEPWKQTLAESEKKLTELLAMRNRAFPKEARYQELVRKKAEIDRALDIGKEESASIGDEGESDVSGLKIETSERPVPTLGSKRDEPYSFGKSDLHHAIRARYESVELKGIDDQTAIAFAANLSGIEYLTRMADYKPDEGARRVNGFHIAYSQMAPFLRFLRPDIAQFGGAAPALLRLRTMAQEAQKAHKSLIFVKDAATIPEQARREVLAEELNHALQASISHGRLDNHLGESAADFVGSPLGQRAQQELEDRGYKFRDASHAAIEIGERLMRGAYPSLGLTPEEAGTLGDDYVRSLRKEYGSAADPIIEKIALSEPRPGASGGDTATGTGTADRGNQLRRDGPGTGTEGGGSGPKVESAEQARSLFDAGGGTNRLQPAGGGRDDGSPEDLALTPQRHTAHGDFETRFNRNLSELRRAAPDVFLPAVNAASARAQANVLLHTAMPLIVKALGKSMTVEQFMRAGTESRLRGRQEFYREQVELAGRMGDGQLARSFPSLHQLFEKLQDKRGFSRHLGQTIASLEEKKDYGAMRALVMDTFEQAANAVTHVMTPEEFDETRYTPAFQDALRIYKDRVETPMRQAHLEHEGVLTDHLGPLNTYFPLVPVKPEKLPGAPARQAYARPANRFNNFATGLAEDYDTSMEAFAQRLTAGLRASGRAGFTDALKEAGLMQPLENGLGPDRNVIMWNGVPYYAVKRIVKDARTVVQNGKITHLPAEEMLLPAWLAGETDPILDKTGDYPPPDPKLKEIFDNLRQGRKPGLNDVVSIVARANDAAVSGVGEPVFHGMNLLGTIIANTPFLGKSLGWKAASLPLVKFGGTLAAVLHTRTTAEQDAAELLEMAKLGMLPNKFGSVTYSRAYARQTGAKLKRLSLSPTLWGPSGADTRARLFMYRLAKQLWNMEGKSPDDYIGMHMFVNQLGIYSAPLASTVERAIKGSPLGRLVDPFVTAGLQMNRNGLHAVAGTGPLPKGRPGLRLWKLLNSAIGIAAIAAFIHRMLNGQWPWEDQLGRLGEMAVRRENVTSPAGRALYKQLYGDAPVGYVKLNFFNPLAARGLRATGIKAAADTLLGGGAWWQGLEAAEKDWANSWSRPFLGPVPRAALVGLTGHEPAVASFYDDRNDFRPLLYKASFERNKGGYEVAKRAAATAIELNSSLGGLLGDSGESLFPELFGAPRNDENAWVRMVFDLATPGLVGAAANPAKEQYYLRRQAALAGRQR
jgi:N12 class adenine-specific DNA methylase